jgi:hypothetical protein
MMNDDRILQMLSAEGWFAVFADEEDEEDNRLEPLVCFALVEGSDERSRRVRPMAWVDESVQFCDSVAGFAGILRSDEVSDDDEEDDEE